MLWNRRIIIVNPKDMRFQNYKSKENKKSLSRRSSSSQWPSSDSSHFPSLFLFLLKKEKERKSARENIMDMSSIWRPNGYRRSRLDRFFLLFDKERKKLSKLAITVKKMIPGGWISIFIFPKSSFCSGNIMAICFSSLFFCCATDNFLLERQLIPIFSSDHWLETAAGRY